MTEYLRATPLTPEDSGSLEITITRTIIDGGPVCPRCLAETPAGATPTMMMTPTPATDDDDREMTDDEVREYRRECLAFLRDTTDWRTDGEAEG